MSLALVWVLNYDAEVELAGGKRKGVPFTGRAPWIGSDDVILGRGAWTADVVADLDGVAWCPTPSALQRLEEAGVRRLPLAPAFEVLRRANARETFADLHPLVSHGACTASTLEDIEIAVRRAAPPRHSGRRPAWHLRESLCAAGQGRFLAEACTEECLAWSRRALRAGPVHIVPVVDVEDEFSAHAFLYSTGDCAFGRHVRQQVRGGVWRAAEAAQSEVPGLEAVLRSVLDRLVAMGYTGPVGVDGFTWRDGEGQLLHAVGTDINARYTMSMAAAFEELPHEHASAR